MAEKNNGKNEGNRDFLERTGVGDWMRDSLAKIVSNRPEDPITFLAQYFDNIEEKNSKLTRAYQLLILTDQTRPTFQNNVSAAYEILTTSTTSKSTSSGLTGVPYRELLNMICGDIPPSIYDRFLTKVGPRDHELIPYCVFYPGVVAAFILVEYYQRTQALFSVVCSQKDSGMVIDRYLAETLVTSLNESIHAAKSDNPLRVLEAGAKFGEEELSDEIMDAMNVSQSSNRPVMKQEEFLDTAVNIYLLEVKPVR